MGLSLSSVFSADPGALALGGEHDAYSTFALRSALLGYSDPTHRDPRALWSVLEGKATTSETAEGARIRALDLVVGLATSVRDGVVALPVASLVETLLSCEAPAGRVVRVALRTPLGDALRAPEPTAAQQILLAANVPGAHEPYRLTVRSGSCPTGALDGLGDPRWRQDATAPVGEQTWWVAAPPWSRDAIEAAMTLVVHRLLASAGRSGDADVELSRRS